MEGRRRRRGRATDAEREYIETIAPLTWLGLRELTNETPSSLRGLAEPVLRAFVENYAGDFDFENAADAGPTWAELRTFVLDTRRRRNWG